MSAPTVQTLPPDVGSIEIVEEAGISYRQLDHWTRLGRLQPVPDPRAGSGRPRRYPPSEIAVAKLLRALNGFGHLPEMAGLCAWVRAGFRGRIEFQPGVLVDLKMICD